jgi:predicted Zn-ribbon and HTH transcriptional regulator
MKKLKKDRKKRRLYIWKCQDCGGHNSRVKFNEPRRCDHCGKKGVQTYIGRG